MKIAVYDVSEKRQKMLREWLIRYSFSHSIDFDIMWFHSASASEKIAHYADDLVISFVSLDSDTDFRFSRNLHRSNSDCRICYYKTDRTSVESLLIYRPSSFFVWLEDESDFMDITKTIFDDIFSSDAFFVCQTRVNLFCYSFRSVLFFESSLKYVTVHKHSGDDDTFFGKLSDIEKKIPGFFVRIHQSYIVNPLFVRSVDKASHTVVLTNGDSLPISGKYYQSVLDSLEKIGSRTVPGKNAVSGINNAPSDKLSGQYDRI